MSIKKNRDLMVEQIKQLRGELNESKYLPKKEVQAIKKWVDASVDMVSDLWDSKEKLVKRILDNVPKKDHKEMIDGLKKAGLYESVNEYDQWRNTRIQSKNIFRMLKQKYNNNIPKMEKGLETILKQNKTKNDQAEVVRQEFKKYFKIKESVNEGYSTEEKRIVMMAVRKLSKYRSVPIDQSINDLLGAGAELQRDIKKGKIKK